MQEIGIRSCTNLTRAEWKALRKVINRNRPRRFSAQFIAAQLKGRNAARDRVRRYQKLGDSDAEVCPTRIEPGTVVTAFNSRFGMLQRGKVLSYDPELPGYLVQFDNAEFGAEVCPDYEVSSRFSSTEFTALPLSPSSGMVTVDCEKSSSFSVSDHSPCP